MYNINDLKVRCINSEDNEDIAKVFLGGFNNKVKNILYVSEERTYDFLVDFGILKTYYKEGYFIAEIDGEILGLMLVRWIGQNKEENKNLGFPRLVKKYGFISALKVLFKINLVNNNPKKGELYIEHIAVSEKARGLGIGSLLLEKTFDMAESMKDIDKVTLSVIEENHRAHELYKRLGFRDVHHVTTLMGKWAVGVYKYTEMEKKIDIDNLK